MLRLIKGRSKSGKTKYLRDYLASLARAGESKLLMIVPDQQTFDTEKAFLSLLGPSLSMNVTVLGFSRLCDYIFDKFNYTQKVSADDPTKALLMSIALEDTADMMSLYGDKALSSQMLSMMLLVRKELIRSKSTPDAIKDASYGFNEVLSKKLSDISLVMSAFDALLERSFSDPDGELSVALDLLCEHRLFSDYTICVDSYLSFTEPEFDIIEQLLIQGKELLVALSDDALSASDSIFSASQQTASRLTACAKNNNIKISAPVVCDYNGFFKSPDLLHIEENFFRSDALSTSLKDSDAVSIYCAADRYEEADFVARNIRRLVMEEGLRYSDFAVVCRDTSPYNGILDTTLSRYGISYFMDTPDNVLSKPLMKLVTAIFRCIIGGFHRDDVMALLKSGITSADPIDVASFENYLFTWSLSGSRLLTEFTANPRGFADEFTTDDMLELSRVEQVRSFIMNPLSKFRDAVRDATASEICRKLYALLLSLGADKCIIKLCDELEASGQSKLSEEQLRLWDIFVESLDRTEAVIGDRRVSPKRFMELLEIQFSSKKLAFIPHFVDQVTVGDIERLRLSDKKVVFVIGAVEGEFPLDLSAGGVFTSAERDALTVAGLLSDNSCEYEHLRERYLCYYALTSASDKLYVSYPGATLTGSPVTPSVIVSQLLSVFEDISPCASVLTPAIDRLWAHKPSFQHFASHYGDNDGLTLALKDYYSDNELYSDSEAALSRAHSREGFSIKNTDNALKLFGTNMNLSASQVEKYHLCRFMYFCNYGLRIRERRAAKIDAMEYGTFVHYILEHFIKKFDKSQLVTLNEEEIQSEVFEIMDTYAETHLGGMEDKSPRFMYLFVRVSTSVCVLIKHLIDELSQSSFTPAAFELGIGTDVPAYKLTLPTGQTVTIRGMVDRADVYNKDGKAYIRIVDYKTGTKVFNLSDVMYGLNLQMLIYLSALSKGAGEYFGAEVVPSGVLYMPAIVPFIDVAFSTPPDKIDKALNEKLRMNGLLLRDEDVLNAMEKDVAGIYIPVSVKGDEYKGADNLATLEEFGAIFSRIDTLVSDMAAELYSGNIGAVPATGGYEACDYCPYSSVCGHKDSDKNRNIWKLDRDDILRELGIDKVDDSQSEEVTP